MKNIKIFTFGLLLLVLTGSCKKFVEGYEKDPNGLLETNTKQIMQGVMLEQQFFLKDDGMRLAMLWLNQATGSDRQFVAFNNWNNVGNNQLNSPWAEVYTVVGQARLMEGLADDIGNNQARGLAKLYRAWAGGMAAALWGDVPFSEAGLLDENPQPKYDAQADVFAQVQALLDDAITDLNDPVGDIYASKDFYYGGDPAKWVNVAHALKARFYLFAGDYANAESEAQQGIASPDDDMVAPYESYTGSYGKWNPTFQFYWNRDGYMSAENSYGANLLMGGLRDNAKTTELARAYYNYEDQGWWNDADINLNVMISAWFGDGINGKFGGPMKLLSYGEMLLIQAEAEARLNGVAAALPIYNQYRQLLAGAYDTGGWEQLGLPFLYADYDEADFQAGGMENADNVSELQAFLRELMEERYVYFTGSLNAFVDHSRTANDADVPSYMELKSGFSGNPLRFIYPQSEIDANPNVPSPAPSVNDPIY